MPISRVVKMRIILLPKVPACSPPPPGDLRFPNFSDVTTKLSKHVRDQFPSGHPLLDSRVTNQVAPEAVF